MELTGLKFESCTLAYKNRRLSHPFVSPAEGKTKDREGICSHRQVVHILNLVLLHKPEGPYSAVQNSNLTLRQE